MRTRPLIVSVVLLLAVVIPAVAAGGSAAGTPAECSYPVTMTDATGTEVTVSEAPTRVVTLGPSAAQTMWELGAQDKVVGVSKYASYLEGAAAKTNISGGGQTFVVAEKVVAANPDIVLAPDIIPNATVAKLRNAGLTVFKFREATSIAAVIRKTERTGRLAGECPAATDRIDRMESELDTIAEAVEGTDRPRVLYVFFGYTAGEGTFLDEIITTAGGENVAATAGISGYSQLNQEVVVQQNPEWIVLNSGSPTVPKTAAYNGTYAVKHDQVVVVDRNLISQPAPRIIQPIRKLVRSFHPEAYAAAKATPTPTATPSPTTQPATDTPTASPQPTTTTSEGQPGFGLFAVLIALILLSVVSRLR